MQDQTLETGLICKVLLKQDNEAFGSLVKLHQNQVRGFLRRLTRNDEVADDIAQDVFVIAYRKLEQFSSNGSFGGWLLSIAYRCFLQHLRQQQQF